MRLEDVPLITSLEAAERAEAQAAALEPQTMRQTSGTPAFLKGMPTEQAKTLKCQECGTMNYATEWYCERCGGELAAM
jgi:ribosomal protein L37E